MILRHSKRLLGPRVTTRLRCVLRRYDLPRWGKRLTIAIALLCFLLSLLAWADAGSSVGPLQVIDLL